MSSGYDYTRDQILELSIRVQFPERSIEESALIWQFLQAHGLEYDSFSVSVRVGAGVTPDPSHLPGVQRQTTFNSQPRIDLLTWAGSQPFIFEVKQRARHDALGQLVTYRQLWMKDHPDAREPRLAVIARTIDPDMPEVFAANGIDVYLYDKAAGGGGTAAGGAGPDNGAPA